MGLFQKAVETYDAMSYLAGVKVEGKEVLAPIGHMIASAKIEITVDEAGNFVRAKKIDEKIVIPCTEKSAGRAGKFPPSHPLCDKVDYIAEVDEEKHNLYMEEVKKWNESTYGTSKLNAIYKYLSKRTVLRDCINAKVVEIGDKGIIKNNSDIITWRVEGLKKESGAVYEDVDLQKNFIQYYLTSNSFTKGLCMVSGENEPLAVQHLKGVSNFAGNAKLISSNDTANYTYRGRFFSDYEAMTMGYLSSQKAHNILKWIVANDGVSFGNRRMVCWNPAGKKIPKFNLPLVPMNKESKVQPTEYGEILNKVVLGYKSKLPESESVVIAAFDAATPGRLSVTYYNELKGSDFLERLYFWDSTCCCYSSFWKSAGSPSLYQIVNYAFGTQRIGEDNTARMETDNRVLAQQMQRIVQCRVDKKLFPIDIMKNIVSNAEKLQLYAESNRETILFTACAVIRKCRLDNFKEDWKMSLEKKKKDRSYQFGRLLAALEKIEKDTYSREEKRETNAIRFQAFFVRRPMIAFEQIMTQLKTAYYPQLSVGTRVYYDKLIGEIMEQISEFDETEIGKPLTETYLMGYYLQKNEFYEAKNIEQKKDESIKED